MYGVRANTSFTVEVKSRLWNSTLVEDYASVDRVEIVSKASVIVDPVYTQEVRYLQPSFMHYIALFKDLKNTLKL